MTVTTTNDTTNVIVLQMSPAIDLSEDNFFNFCQLNSHLRIERTSTGELIIMSPAGSETGNRNFKLIQQLANWTDKDGTGIGFDSSAGFILPNGATRSPDASWIELSKWNALSDAQKAKFAPLCPDFVVEIRSPSDSLKSLKDKMQEYIDNGVKLGWLIEPKTKIVEIYRRGKSPEVLKNPKSISGESTLPGFILDVSKILS